jgi:integrase
VDCMAAPPGRSNCPSQMVVIGRRGSVDRRDGLRALFAALLYSGMRRGEALGLRWADVDLDRRIITIRRSYAAMTKSGKQRTVPIATPLVDILKAHRIADPWKGELVFPNDSGAMYSPAAKLEHVLDAALARAGMPRIRVHDLRHAAASFFLMNGGDVFTLRKILGPSTPQLVSDTYGDLSDSHLAGEADPSSSPSQASWRT